MISDYLNILKKYENQFKNTDPYIINKSMNFLNETVNYGLKTVDDLLYAMTVAPAETISEVLFDAADTIKDSINDIKRNMDNITDTLNNFLSPSKSDFFDKLISAAKKTEGDINKILDKIEFPKKQPFVFDVPKEKVPEELKIKINPITNTDDIKCPSYSKHSGSMNYIRLLPKGGNQPISIRINEKMIVDVFPVENANFLKASIQYKYGDYIKNLLDQVASGIVGKFVSALTSFKIFKDIFLSYMKKQQNEFTDLSLLDDSVNFGTFNHLFINLANLEDVSTYSLGPIELVFRFGQFGLYNAYEEVYKPCITLTKLCMPVLDEDNIMRGILVSKEGFRAIFTAMVAGYVVDVFKFVSEKTEKKDSLNSNVSQSILDKLNYLTSMGNIQESLFHNYKSRAQGGLYDLELGYKDENGAFIRRLRYEDIVIPDVYLNFSKEVDDSGYPIMGKVTFNNLRSLVIPYKRENEGFVPPFNKEIIKR